MFVPYTAHSELATRLRDSEETMQQMTGYRLKIVDKVSCKLVDMLTKANPWAGEQCGRRRCLLCKTKEREGKENSQDWIATREIVCIRHTACHAAEDKMMK